MTTQSIIQAMPFNTGVTRPWAPYELAVIHQAILDGVSLWSPSSTEIAATKALTMAIASSPSFATSFAPAPAVPANWFYCLGKNWARNRLDPSLVSGIQSGAITPSFFAACNDFRPPLDATIALKYNDFVPWYGAIQTTKMMQPPDWLSEQRSRTQYIATTGKQAIALLQRLTSSAGVSLPPDLQQMISLANSSPASLLMERPVTIAIALRDAKSIVELLQQIGPFLPIILSQLAIPSAPRTLPPEAIAALRKFAADTFEDVVMIWGPGQGASLMPIVMGTADFTTLIGMAVAMGTSVPGGIPPQLQQAVAGAIGVVQGILTGGKVPLQGIEMQAGPTTNPMVTKTRDELLAGALPPPPLPPGIVAVNAPLVDAAPPGDTLPSDNKKISPVALGAIAVAALLVVGIIVRGGAED